MNESIYAGKDFHKRAKVCNADHFAGVDISNDCAVAQGLHPFLCNLCANCIGRSDVDGAIFLDVDLCTSLFLQGTDVLSAGTDQRTNLVYWNLDRNNAWRE